LRHGKDAVEKGMKILQSMGFDAQLYPYKVKTFVLTIHSVEAVTMSISDLTKPGSEFADIENQLNLQLILKANEIVERKEGKYTLFVKEHE
jgi:hypothetical protein